MDQQAAAVTGSPEGLRVPLAFEEFYETERERLFLALLLVTHDSAEAEDLMQEAFVRIFKTERRLELWLRRGPAFALFQVYEICNWSGELGPKLKE